jgi:hypothetical protein
MNSVVDLQCGHASRDTLCASILPGCVPTHRGFFVPDSESRVIDVRVPLRSGFANVFLATLILAFLIVIPLAIVGSPPWMRAPLVVVLLPLAARLEEQQQRGEVLNRVENHRRNEARVTDPEKFFQGALLDYPRRVLGMLAESRRGLPVVHAIAARLLEQGHAGSVFRLSRDPGALPEIETPFDVPFEPVPLRERDTAFQELCPSDSPPRGFAGRAWLHFLRQAGRSRFKAALLLLFAVASLVFLAAFLAEDLLGLLADRPPEFIPGLVMICMLAALPLVLYGGLRTCDWLIVPGGLIVRESPWHSTRWRLHRVPAGEAILTYWQDLNLLCVTSADGLQFGRRATAAEADAAIRAWLSPLEPPPLERLSDLV